MKRFLKFLFPVLLILAPNSAYAGDASDIIIAGPKMCSEDATPSLATEQLDATTSYLVWVFQCPEAATLTGAKLYYGARTGTPPTYKVDLQGVDGSGNKDGTIKGGGSPASVTFTPPANTSIDDTVQTYTFANSYACTRGEALALVVEYSSGTVNASNRSSFGYRWSNCNTVNGNFPYTYRVLSGAATRYSDTPAFEVHSASKAYGEPRFGFSNTQFSSDSTPDEYGMAFKLPSAAFGVGTTYTVGGVRLNFRSGAAAKSYKIILYSGTSALQSVTIDTDMMSANTTANRQGIYYFSDSSLTALTAGTEYIVSIQPQDTAHSTALYTWTGGAAGDLSAWPGGAAFYLKTRTDAGAWSDATTKRPMIDLIIKDITVPASGGVIRVNTNGGSQ